MKDTDTTNYRPSKPEPTPELKRLGFLVGKWQMKGTIKESSWAPGGPIEGEHEWAWFNEYFMCHTWGQELGVGVEYIGWDAPNNRFHTHYFDDNGPYDEEGSTYEGEFRGNSYVLCGPARLTYTPSANGKTIKFTGEFALRQRHQGLDAPDSDWADSMEATFTKID